MAFLTSVGQIKALEASPRGKRSLAAQGAFRWRILPRISLLFSFLFSSLIAPQAIAQSASEYQLKAAFLFNFTQFVDWPAKAFPSPESPIVIGVLGSDPFKGSLDEVVRGERIQNRMLVTARFRRLEDVQNCHLLFISQSEKGRLTQILAELRGRPVLTTSDIDGFAESGGVIGFFREGNKIRFRVNLTTARAEDLKISSKLLRLADVIGKEGAE